MTSAILCLCLCLCVCVYRAGRTYLEGKTTEVPALGLKICFKKFLNGDGGKISLTKKIKLPIFLLAPYFKTSIVVLLLGDWVFKF